MFEELFDKYVKDFNLENRDILLKYNHSRRVKDLASKYTDILGFNKEDKKLAEFIALYHDLGRFNQLNIYNTYNDSKSINHAEEGIKELLRNDILEKVGFTEEEKKIIIFSIRNHNKIKIEETNNERFLKHAKLIRDLDKIDIVYLEAFLDDLEIKVEDEKISENIISKFKNKEQIEHMDIPNIGLITCFGYTFDINNDECLEEFKTNIEGLYKRINNENFKEIYEIVTNYIEKRKELC